MASVSDRLIFAFFLLTAVTCLGLSAMFHTFLSHSAHMSHVWLQLDFFGIIVLTLGDSVSGTYVIFYCEPGLQGIYWTMIISLCSASIFILLDPKLNRWRTFRVCTFVCTGLFGFLPLVHGVKILGFSQMLKQSGMLYYLGEGLLLILGTLFYTMRIPESFRPGRFDIFGCSHQIFHVLVVLATVVHLIGILSAFDYHHRYQTCGLSEP